MIDVIFKLPLRSRTRQECLLSQLSENTVLELLARAIRQEDKKKKAHRSKEKKIKLSLFVDNTMLYVANPKEPSKTPKLVILIS